MNTYTTLLVISNISNNLVYNCISFCRKHFIKQQRCIAATVWIFLEKIMLQMFFFILDYFKISAKQIHGARSDSMVRTSYPDNSIVIQHRISEYLVPLFSFNNRKLAELADWANVKYTECLSIPLAVLKNYVVNTIF